MAAPSVESDTKGVETPNLKANEQGTMPRCPSFAELRRLFMS